MARGKRAPSDSVGSEVNTFKLIRNSIQPNQTLSDQGMIYFNIIINARERVTWNELDIDSATRLAMVNCQIDDTMKLLDQQGWYIPTGTGTIKRHPAAQQLDSLFTLRTRQLQILGLHAAGRNITTTDQKARNQKGAQMAAASKRADDSGGVLA